MYPYAAMPITAAAIITVVKLLPSAFISFFGGTESSTTGVCFALGFQFKFLYSLFLISSRMVKTDFSPNTNPWSTNWFSFFSTDARSISLMLNPYFLSLLCLLEWSIAIKRLAPLISYGKLPGFSRNAMSLLMNKIALSAALRFTKSDSLTVKTFLKILIDSSIFLKAYLFCHLEKESTCSPPWSLWINPVMLNPWIEVVAVASYSFFFLTASSPLF